MGKHCADVWCAALSIDLAKFWTETQAGFKIQFSAGRWYAPAPRKLPTGVCCESDFDNVAYVDSKSGANFQPPSVAASLNQDSKWRLQRICLLITAASYLSSRALALR